MKKLILTITILLVIIGRIVANNDSDSLFTYLKSLNEKQQVDTLKSVILKNIFRDPKIAFIYVNKFSSLPGVAKDSVLLCLSNYWKGMIYEMFGDYQMAIEYDFKSLSIAKKINNKRLIGISLNNIGLVYSYQKPYYDKALIYFKEYLKISKETENLKEIMGAYMNIGMQYQRMEKYDSCDIYYYKAFEIAKHLNSKRHIAIAYSLLAENEKMKGNTELFVEYSRNAIKIYKDEEYLIDLAALYYDVSKYFLEQKNTDSAMYYAKEMFNIANKFKLTTYRQNSLLQLSEIYFSENNFNEAFTYLQRYVKLKDSVTSQETKEKLAQLQTIYEVEIKDKEIENLKIQKRLQSRKELFYLFLIIVVIVVSLMVILSVVAKRRKDKIVNKQKLIIYEKEKQLSVLALEKSKANEKELETKLAFKTRQLTTHAVSMMQKNKLMTELSASIAKVSKYVNNNQKDEIRKLQLQIKRSLNVEKDWELFKMYFEQVNKDFFSKLLVRVPNLSSNDLRLSALIKLNMNIKEAASVFNVEPASVKSARYRLRKKLELKQEDDLYDYMSKI